MKHHLYTIIFAIGLMLTVGITTASAEWKTTESKHLNGFVYSLNFNTETNECKGSLSEVDKDNIPSGEITLPSSIIGADGNSYPITQMGSPWGGIFSSSVGTPCPNITKLTIPGSYKTVYAQVLTGLTEVVLAEGTELIDFSGCDKLATINYPQSVTELNMAGTGITSIVLDDHIKSFKISSCKELTQVTLPPSLTTLPDYAFSGCEKLENVDFPESITAFGSNVFSNSGFKKVIVPPHVKELKGAFNEANNLVEVVLNDELERLDGTFDYCENLQKVTFDKSLKFIGDASFRNTGLIEVDIPDNVEHLGFVAFAFCTKLKKVHLGKGIKSLRAYSETWTPEKAVEGSIFYGDTDIEEVIINGEIEDFGEATFESVYKLRAMPKCNSVKIIGRQCFRNTFLKELIIPASVDSIGKMAFDLSPFLSEQDDDYSLIRCEAVVPPTMGESAFQQRILQNRTLWVPKGSLTAYQQADGWKEFKDIQEFDPVGIAAPSQAEGTTTKVYNLQGSKVLNPGKGLYIINHKKVILK